MSWEDAGKDRKDRERLLWFQKDGARVWPSRERRYQKGEWKKTGKAVEEKEKGFGGRGKTDKDMQQQSVMVGCELWHQTAWFKHVSNFTTSCLCNSGQLT